VDVCACVCVRACSQCLTGSNIPLDAPIQSVMTRCIAAHPVKTVRFGTELSLGMSLHLAECETAGGNVGYYSYRQQEKHCYTFYLFFLP
jgi:hypothetical protein